MSLHTLWANTHTFGNGQALNLDINPYRQTAAHTHTRPRCMKHSHQTCCEIFTWELGSPASRCVSLQVMRWRGCSILIMSLESDVWLSINTKSHLRVWWGDQIVNKSTAAAQHDKIWPLQNSQQAQANKNPCLSL